MIKSLSEFIKTSQLLSELDVKMFTIVNTHPLHQLEEVPQYANIVKHLCVFIL